MKINRDIINALNEAIKKAGTQVLLSKKCGIRRNYFSKYLNGEHKSISHEKWLILYPYLEEFLPEHMREKNSAGVMPMEEKLLLDAFREFSPAEKETAIREFIIKAEIKKARKAG